MIAAPMILHDDCMSSAVASLLELPIEDVPYCTPRLSWDEGWRRLRDWFVERGWRLEFVEHDRRVSFADYLDGDWPEPYIHWIASVSHASWPDDEAHAIVMEGNRIAFDPAAHTGPRPPLDELRFEGAFVLQPIDPARFALR